MSLILKDLLAEVIFFFVFSNLLSGLYSTLISALKVLLMPPAFTVIETNINNNNKKKGVQ